MSHEDKAMFVSRSYVHMSTLLELVFADRAYWYNYTSKVHITQTLP